LRPLALNLIIQMRIDIPASWDREHMRFTPQFSRQSATAKTEGGITANNVAVAGQEQKIILGIDAAVNRE